MEATQQQDHVESLVTLGGTTQVVVVIFALQLLAALGSTEQLALQGLQLMQDVLHAIMDLQIHITHLQALEQGLAIVPGNAMKHTTKTELLVQHALPVLAAQGNTELLVLLGLL